MEFVFHIGLPVYSGEEIPMKKRPQYPALISSFSGPIFMAPSTNVPERSGKSGLHGPAARLNDKMIFFILQKKI